MGYLCIKWKSELFILCIIIANSIIKLINRRGIYVELPINMAVIVVNAKPEDITHSHNVKSEYLSFVLNIALIRFGVSK